MKIYAESIHEYITADMLEAMETTKVLYVPCSKDSKTGLVSGIYSSENTCPISCPFKGSGCYAENFRCKAAWKRATSSVHSIPTKADEEGKLDLLRVNIAGDMAVPGTNKLNLALVDYYIKNVCANTRAWTYTHCTPSDFNKAVVRYACENGFTISFSCESLTLANKLQEEGLPVVVATDKVTESDGTYYVCQGGKNGITCRKCKYCTKAKREKIVVFNLHGSRVKAAREAIKDIE